MLPSGLALGVLHVKQLALVVAILLGGCKARPEPTPPRPSTVDAPSRDVSHTVTASPDVPAPLPSPAATRGLDWRALYSDTPLSPAETETWLAALRGPHPERAAQVLGRRLPASQLQPTFERVPPQVLTDYLRGIAGRKAGTTPEMPVSLLGHLGSSDTALEVATAMQRNRWPVTLTHELVVPLLVSSSDRDQLAGARLLALAATPTPALMHLAALRPHAAAVAARNLVARPTFRATELRPLAAMWAERALARPRDWLPPLLALAQATPAARDDLQRELIAALGPLQTLSLGDDEVDARFRCQIAQLADIVSGGASIHGTPTTPPWLGLQCEAQLWGRRAPSPAGASALSALIANPSSNASVIESVIESLKEYPAGLARPVLAPLLASTDPGVLAALLEHYVLHVQQFRALAQEQQRALIARPFEIEEAVAMEARLEAISLAMSMGLPPPGEPSAVRAVVQRRRPDAGVAPAETEAPRPPRHGTLVIETSAGTLVVRPDPEAAPRALETVIAAANRGAYRGTRFHRVIAGFVAQGGDPRGDGYGGATAITPTEISGHRFVRGSVGMALAGLDTGGMQFFIVTADAPHLDGRYPWLGEVVQGLTHAERLMPGDRILELRWVPDENER